MATYDHKQVIADYAHGRITPDMAVGHSLQHIDQIYAARNEWRVEVDALQAQLTLVPATAARLQAVIDKARAKQKLPKTTNPSGPDQA